MKMNGMNEVMDEKIKDIHLNYLDEENIYQNFKRNLLAKSKVKGKKLASSKHYTPFEFDKWPKTSDCYDHQGNLISRTGHKLDEE